MVVAATAPFNQTDPPTILVLDSVNETYWNRFARWLGILAVHDLCLYFDGVITIRMVERVLTKCDRALLRRLTLVGSGIDNWVSMARLIPEGLSDLALIVVRYDFSMVDLHGMLSNVKCSALQRLTVQGYVDRATILSDPNRRSVLV